MLAFDEPELCMLAFEAEEGTRANICEIRKRARANTHTNTQMSKEPWLL